MGWYKMKEWRFFLLKQFRQVTRANQARPLEIVTLALLQTSMSIEEREKYNTKVDFAIGKTRNSGDLLCLQSFQQQPLYNKSSIFHCLSDRFIPDDSQNVQATKTGVFELNKEVGTLWKPSLFYFGVTFLRYLQSDSGC